MHIRRIGMPILLFGLLLCQVAPLDASKENLRLLSGAARQAVRGDTATALQVVERVLGQPERDEAKAYALYLKGLLINGKGQGDSAKSVWLKLIVEYPASSYIGMALAQLGILFYGQGEDSSAVRVLEPVAANFRDSSFTPPALVALVRAADRGGLDKKAIRAGLEFLSLPGGDQNRVEVLQRTAALLYRAGRSEEAWNHLRRIEERTGKSISEMDLGIQMLAIGCLTGIGRPDSSLRLAEELRRSSGEQVLNTPGMQFLIGQARYALGELDEAGSIFSSLLSKDRLESDGVRRDTVLALLMNIERRQARWDRYFEHASARVEGLEESEKAMGVLRAAAAAARQTGRLEGLGRVIEAFGGRFSASPSWREARLLQTGVLASRGERNQALTALSDLKRSGADSAFLARVNLATAELYLVSGDTLRAEAELRDYLAAPSDPLGNLDSVLWVRANIGRARGDYRTEQTFLLRLTGEFAASRFWENADARLEQLRRFDLSRPQAAANELLDLYTGGTGQATPQRLAEIAADYLSDYDRAANILRSASVSSPTDRCRLAEYLYLAGLRDLDRGSRQGAEKIAQAWNELTHVLGESGDFPERDRAVRLYLEIHRSRSVSLSPSQLSGAEEVIRAELAGLDQGPARAAVLLWLGERYRSAAQTDSGFTAMAMADSARGLWSEAIRGEGEPNQVGRAYLELARSVENAGFAGARDSAAHLYGALINRYPATRWSALAGPRLAAIHLEQERYSVAYEAVRSWLERNPAGADNSEVRAVLAAASYHTGRFGRAADLFSRIALDSLPPDERARFECYHIRSLAEMGDYAGASAMLGNFFRKYKDLSTQMAGFTVAVKLYLAAGNLPLAAQYLARIPENGEFYPLARVWWLTSTLGQGGDSEKLRKELERFRKAPWNSFYEADPALLAYKGIMAVYMAEGKPEKVEEARNEFRRNYPERRAGQAGLMLDEIDYLLRNNDLNRAGALYDDMRLLFGDVFPEDRILWARARLARSRGDMAAYSSTIEKLAGGYEWSPWAWEAKKRLLGLYISANRVDQAEKMVEKMQPETLTEPEKFWMQAMLLGARGDWDGAWEQYSRYWALRGSPQEAGEAVLDWAQAALKAQQTERARDLLLTLWSADPQTVAEARFLLASMYRNAREYGAAIDVVEGLREAYPARNEIVLRSLYQKGLTQESMGELEGAAATYRLLEGMAGERNDWSRSARDRLRAIGADRQGQSSQ